MAYMLSEYIELLKEKGLIKDTNITTDREVEHISYNSQDIKENTLFICKGIHFKDEYLKDAVKKGAICYISERKMDANCDYIICTDIRKTIACVADMFFEHAWKKINLIGITGTKGKSTTTYFLRYILDDYLKDINENASAVISSIDTYDGVENFESHLTTPEAIELHKHFNNAYSSNIKYMTMEVSSQALKYSRVEGVTFDVGCFLNIGYDHISDIEHPDFEDYFKSKLKIFKSSKAACVCLDSKRADEVLRSSKECEKVITFSSENENADVYAYDIKKSGSDTVFMVRTKDFDSKFTLTIPGLFNVQNALAAISICSVFNIPKKNIEVGLMKARSDGRMEVYNNADRSVTVIVDYAHNKMSFENLFDSCLKEFPQRNIYTVFGCPGNKAHNRRKDLGEISGRFSDKVFLTEEDAGEEPVENICNDIAHYVKMGKAECIIEPDREEAIKKAICEAKTPALVLITGKGNETRQKRGTKYIDCPSDVELTKKYLKQYDVSHNLDPKEKINGFRQLLPLLKKLYKKKVVVKLGGSVMEQKELFEGVFDDIAMLKSAGADVVLIHGGGASITRFLKRLNVETEFVNGYRRTSKEAAQITEMVLSAKVNKQIVANLEKEGIKAVGISGKDANLLVCDKKEELGFVGSVREVNERIIEHLLSGGYVPVISPVSTDDEFNTLNVNADEAAFKIAEAIKADELVFLTDVDGLLLDVNNEKTLVGTIECKKVTDLIEKGMIEGGMLPKIKACVHCVENGVDRVHIINGNIEYNLITSLISPDNTGTVITK